MPAKTDMAAKMPKSIQTMLSIVAFALLRSLISARLVAAIAVSRSWVTGGFRPRSGIAGLLWPWARIARLFFPWWLFLTRFFLARLFLDGGGRSHRVGAVGVIELGRP
nr:hypothetical protein FA04_17910 [Ensifer adhaerens]